MILVLDYGMGNIHSCIKALSLFSSKVVFSGDVKIVSQAEKIVLPGDGCFSKAMENLKEKNLIPALKEHVEKGKPILGICIGYQILFEDSEENPNQPGTTVKGLGFIQGQIRKFRLPKNLKVPHMGWNQLIHVKKRSLLESIHDGTYMYFIHSYRPIGYDKKDIAAYCNYGGDTFPAVVVKNNIMGTQFHPEKSDKYGLKILENFVKKSF